MWVGADIVLLEQDGVAVGVGDQQRVGVPEQLPPALEQHKQQRAHHQRKKPDQCPRDYSLCFVAVIVVVRQFRLGAGSQCAS